MNERPLSNYVSSKYHIERKNPPVMIQQSKVPTSRARDNVKFENIDNIPRSCHQEQIRKVCNNEHYSAQNKELYDSIANGNLYKNGMESEIDSVYSSNCFHDNESEMESLYDQDEYTNRALRRMETKVNTFTNRFVNKVKSEVDETFSKIKIQSKFNSTKVKNPKVEKGSGDTVRKSHDSVENDAAIKKILKSKSDCYDKIEQQLKILQKIDQLTDKLYKNHIE